MHFIPLDLDLKFVVQLFPRLCYVFMALTTPPPPPPRMCLEARDPYCGWDFRQHRCTTLEESSNMSQWKQNITACPV